MHQLAESEPGGGSAARRRVYTSRRTLSHLERITPLDNLHHVASPTPQGEDPPSGGNSLPGWSSTRKTLLHQLADKEGLLDHHAIIIIAPEPQGFVIYIVYR